jgi:hypothetical protein
MKLGTLAHEEEMAAWDRAATVQAGTSHDKWTA